MNLIAVVVLLVLLFVVSERWWFSSVLTYLPRTHYLLPSLVLLGCAIRWHRKSLWLNLVAIGVIAGPVAGLQLPKILAETTTDSSWQGVSNSELKIVSCNVQAFQPDFATVLQEISAINPHVVVFQEAVEVHPLVNAFFRDWNSVHVGEFWVGSKFPLRLIGECDTAAFDRTTAIKVEIEGPTQKFVLTNVHLMTARRGLTELSIKNVLTGEGPDRLERQLLLRNEEARVTRDFVSAIDRSIPSFVVGDLNVPVSSSLFQDHWGDFTNAFDVAGSGYGYTSPCAPHRFWFNGVPWIRIDHILTSPHWRVIDCRVGTQNGSDHRMIATTVVLGR